MVWGQVCRNDNDSGITQKPTTLGQDICLLCVFFLANVLDELDEPCSNNDLTTSINLQRPVCERAAHATLEAPDLLRR
jgi:hypothetical protein